MNIPSWKEVKEHAEEYPAGLWLVRPTGEMPVIIALEARVLSTVWGRCVASGKEWHPLSWWSDNGAVWLRCDDDGVPVDVSADLRRQLAEMEAEKTELQEKYDWLEVRLQQAYVDLDTLRKTATEKQDQLKARIAELEAERVPGSEREFQARLDAMQAAESIVPPSPISAESLDRMDEMKATVPGVQALPVTGSVTVEAPEYVIVHKETDR